MFRILESQAPVKQTASDTISTLSGRLQSATLLEDRRAAILGLRSFAKLYPASVASGALRSLINSLTSDSEDVETIKVVLETLLMLFNPDDSSAEASDDIALWLADEFTQRQENITVLLDLLDRQEFFSRLYSLQLISAISSARPTRTQECVYTAPLGVSRLVAVLDDRREAIRSEGLLLLVALTPASQEFQKLVAFENAFERIFKIIEADGSLCHGGIVVQDCLSLLANLLRLNVSNQSFFRETGGVPKVADMLRQCITDTSAANETSEWNLVQRDKNLWGFMSVVRLFLAGGNISTQMNQNSFWQHHVTFYVLDIAFHPSMSSALRCEAFFTCADLINANNTLQENFGQRTVMVHTNQYVQSSDHATKSNGVTFNEPTLMNVIQGLLDIALAVSLQAGFDVRLAACECIKAYLNGHASIRDHFLRRAKDGYFSADVEPDNVFTILLEDGDTSFSPDPYRQWTAAVILFHLLHDDHDAKKVAMEVVQGDAEKGEDIVTCIQALSGNLLSKAQRGVDDRVTLGYLMVLIGWLFEDPDAVNDFLQEGANVQTLVQLILQPDQQRLLEAGLCAFLLGIIYEFSTRDSPISRSKLHDILTTRLGRDQYNDKMAKLREHPFIRDFEVIRHENGSGRSDVIFDKTFVDFLKDNFSRMCRAIDRDPSMEIPVLANGVQKGISRDLVDSLKSQLEDKSQTLQKAESEVLTLERKLGQEQADHRKAKEMALVEANRVKSINEILQRHHEEETHSLQERHDATVSTLQSNLRETDEQNKTMAEKLRTRHREEVNDLKTSLSRLEKQVKKASKDHAQDLSTAHEEYSSATSALETRLKRAEKKVEEAEERAMAAETRALEAGKSVIEKEAARASVQAELDDMLMVLGDLEEKRSQDKARLKQLGEDVSDTDEIEDDAASSTTESTTQGLQAGSTVDVD